MASTLCTQTHAHLSHKAKDLELSQNRNQPCTPRIAAGPTASLWQQHCSWPSLPPKWHLKEEVPAGLSGWTGKPGTGRFMPREGEERVTKRSINSGQLPRSLLLTLISWKTTKRKTACHVNPDALTFLSFLDNSQNLLKFGDKLKNPLLPHSICRNEVRLKTQFP